MSKRLLHSTPLHVTSRHATPRHATPRHATPRHATPRHATPRHATPRIVTPRPATPRHATPLHATPRHTTPLHLVNLVVFILVADSDFFLDFPTRQNTTYVETATLPSLEEFTLSFWIKQGFDGSLRSGIMSYTTTEELKSLRVVLGSAGALNLRIMDSRFVTTCYKE